MLRTCAENDPNPHGHVCGRPLGEECGEEGPGDITDQVSLEARGQLM